MSFDEEIGPNADDWINFGRIWGPKWPDGCNHPDGSYVATFEVCESPRSGIETIDLYCFDNGGRQEFCLRYGSADNEYYSPGDIVGIIRSQQHLGRYKSALGILMRLGTVKWAVDASAANDDPTSEELN